MQKVLTKKHIQNNPFAESLKSIPEVVLCGISGGVDSIVLLHSLVEAGKKPIVLHFEHGWRKDETLDSKLVEELSKKLNVEFIKKKSEKSFPKTEAGAREERFRFFIDTAQRKNCYNLVLAHHADDQVETFLMQLLRGTGTKGWGMDKISSFGKLTIYRPFLDFWKADIIAFAKKNLYCWREDETNDNALYLRNKIRKELIPFLENRFSKSVKKSLWKFCEILREEKKWLMQLTQEIASGPSLRFSDLEKAPIGKQRLAIGLWLKKRGVADISFEDIESIREMIGKKGKKKCNLSRNLAVIFKNDELVLTHQ
ncbi:tRNA(Ile)-lysidine synthetase [Methylacidiphilum kamchatkense Kam1]|uniref:tRNA(Ile)-lysidine synthase n=1 Tax=Methylacidiphilum kamchatkense Kam1 TaxID=1202785 RepID=A0A0C1URQ7_9BACT|nr:tRNA lysidine(34) synthetase TilS [Methylacidiphilum kamchatkense]KIE58518.1 tRNA(Ile)-lysidine synthetase [Methylacidiphilum kamchatkense Kam1]QDQ43335.1 tRNA(Ile)-lysidine synthase [Methylacidiphilum kamchatkense Kam1]